MRLAYHYLNKRKINYVFKKLFNKNPTRKVNDFLRIIINYQQNARVLCELE